MKRILLILSLVALTGAVQSAGVRSAATAADRSASSTDGAVVFTSNRDGDSDLYAVNPDGTGLTQLTNDPTDESEPLPSPDGRHILFHGGEDGELKVMDADGSGRRSLRDCSVNPDGWSPDSRHVVCSLYDEGVLILDTVDGTVMHLADSGRNPSWSPDGTTIALVDESKLYVIPATGGTRRRLGIRKVEQFAAPAWSPDSQRVAYIAPTSADRDALWTIRADGSGGRRIAQNVGDDTPRWSPDGSRIAFLKFLAHDRSAVFVVRTDGTGSREASSGRGGVYARDPSWSADGRLVLYNRGRFRDSEDSDIFAVAPSGRGGRALTHPFPTGGTNFEPQWLVGPRLSGGEQLPPTIAVPFKRTITFARAIGGIATDGTRVVPTLLAETHPALTIWDSASGRSLRGPVPCPNSYGPGSLSLAGNRLAWTCSEAGNTYYAVQLLTAAVGDRRMKSVASAAGDPNEGGDDIVGLLGRGKTIAFSIHYDARHGSSDPWLLLTHRAKKCPDSDYYNSLARCRRMGRALGATTAIDAGRVVTVAGNGVVRILSLRGRALRSWSVGERVVTARLRGRTLAVQHGRTIDVYNAKTGAKTTSGEMLTDGGPLPRLLDIQGDLVLYETGGAIHLLHLSLAHDRALRLPGAAPYLDAHLEPAGLFVSWNQMYARRQGRVAFIPLRALRP
jgi:TolB protein